MDDQKRKGIRLRDLRKANRLTQEKLAELTELSKDALSKMERGESNPSTESLERIARVYRMKLYELLAYIDDPDDSPRAQAIRDILAMCRRLDDLSLELVRRQVTAVDDLARAVTPTHSAGGR